MAILLIGLIILLGGLAYGRSRKDRRAQLSPPNHFNDHRAFDGLFAEKLAQETRQLALQETQARASMERNALLNRAQRGDLSALAEAAAYHEADLYSQTLQALIDSARAEPDAAALADYIIDSGKLRANGRLAELIMKSEASEPSTKSIARLLYIAALADNEKTYHQAARVALCRLQQKRIAAADLRALFESSYWLVAPEIRQANFSLQQLMADMRRALAATHAPSTQTDHIGQPRADRAQP